MADFEQEDAILDYAIGLERLLTAGINNELSYRFALRGATILGWFDGNKELFFNKLNNFYKLRSSIVHGSIGKKPKLSSKEACSAGEDHLRNIWWWYFENGFKDAKNGLKDGTEVIDSCILKTSYLQFFEDDTP